jgi:hypothetical protein
MQSFFSKPTHVGRITLVVCLLNCFCFAYAQPVRDKLIKTAASQLNVREKTGHNDGKEVETYLRSVDRRKGDAWCAAFISWVHIENNVPNPESGWSPDWFKANVIWKRTWTSDIPVIKPGCVMGLFYQNLGRVGHVGIIEYEDANNYYTIEGNTNRAGSREGDGVYRKIRPKSTVYVISDYCMKKNEYFEYVKKLYGN